MSPEQLALFRENEFLVAKWTRDTRGRFPTLIDSDREALVREAFMSSVMRYDGSVGVPFSTFGWFRVRSVIGDYLRELDVLSRRARDQVTAYRRAEQDLLEALGRNPTDEEIQTRMGVDSRVFERIRYSLTVQRLSIDAPISADQDINWGDRIPGAGINPDEKVIADEMAQDLHTLVSGLPPKQRRVIEACILGDASQSDMARELGVTEASVSLLKIGALKTLRRWALQSDLRPGVIAA